jgi:hypothetical protein
MIVQIVEFQSKLNSEKINELYKKRAAEYEKMPSLIQKYYVKTEDGKRFGVYMFGTARNPWKNSVTPNWQPAFLIHTRSSVSRRKKLMRLRSLCVSKKVIFGKNVLGHHVPLFILNLLFVFF